VAVSSTATIRPAAVAGAFYSGDPAQLAADIANRSAPK